VKEMAKSFRLGRWIIIFYSSYDGLLTLKVKEVDRYG